MSIQKDTPSEKAGNIKSQPKWTDDDIGRFLYWLFKENGFTPVHKERKFPFSEKFMQKLQNIANQRPPTFYDSYPIILTDCIKVWESESLKISE